MKSQKMKKSIFLLIVMFFVTSVTFAQRTFEGTIRHEIKYLGESADQMAAFAPSGTVYMILGNDLKFRLEGGMTAAMMGDILVKGKEGISYMLKDDEQIAYKFTSDDEEVEEVHPVITKEDEIITIVGHQCQKYKVVTTTEEGEVVTYVWTTLDFVFPKFKGSSTSGNVVFEGVPGVPLKHMTTMDMMGMSITTIYTAIELTEGKLSAEEFEIPENYEIKEFDPSSMFGGGGN
jgi:hypothetical protein